MRLVGGALGLGADHRVRGAVEDPAAVRVEERDVEVDALRLVYERPHVRAERAFLAGELVEGGWRLREEPRVDVEGDALARERHRVACAAIAHRVDGLGVVARDVPVRKRVTGRSHEVVGEVAAEPLVRADEDVGPVVARDRRLELRGVRVVGHREQRDVLAALLRVHRGDGLERLLLCAAVRMPHDDPASGLVAPGQEREGEGEGDEKGERSLHACAATAAQRPRATPVFGSKR